MIQMSASREKRTRQSDPSLTEKQELAEQTAAAAKQKTRLYTILGIVAAVAVAALLIWDSGLFHKDSTAMVINDREYSAGEVSYYYGLSRQQYAYYLQYMGYDPNLSDREQIFDSSTNQTYYDLFMEGAKTSMIQVAALADAARAEGMTLTEAAQADVDTALATYNAYALQYGYNMDSYLKANFGEFMTEEILVSCMKEDALANQYYTAYAQELNYTDADLKAYYDENSPLLDTFVYDMCFVNGLLSGEDVTDEQKQAAMELAKSEAEKLLDATDFSVEASLIASKDDNSYYNEDLHSIGSNLGTLYASWLADETRKDGDVTVIEGAAAGYYVLRFHDRYLDTEALGEVDIRHILVKAEVAEGEDAPTDEAMAAAKAEAQSILDTYLAGEKTGDAFGKLAAEYSEDPGSASNGGLYAGVTRSTNFFPGFLNWIFEDGRKVGDTGLVENPQSGQQGWHVMYLDAANQLQWEMSAEGALMMEDINAWTTELKTGYEAVEASGIKHVG